MLYLGVVAAVLTACTPEAPAAAGLAVVGRWYSYDFYVHCGLESVPINFDGSEWRVADGEWDRGTRNVFQDPVDSGQVRLDGSATGTYRSSGGMELRIDRLTPQEAAEFDGVQGCL